MKDIEIAFLSDKIKNVDLLSIKDKELKDNSLVMLNLKSSKIGLVLGFLFGAFGVDRFYKGDYLLGAIKLVIFLFGYVVPLIYLVFNLEYISADFDNSFITIIVLIVVSFIISLIWQIADLFLVYKGIYKDNFKKVLLFLKEDD